MSDKKPVDLHQGAVEVPFEQLDPEALQNLIQEFVMRDGTNMGDVEDALESKVAQVMRQLKNKQARVVYDLKSETANIVSCR